MASFYAGPSTVMVTNQWWFDEDCTGTTCTRALLAQPKPIEVFRAHWRALHALAKPPIERAPREVVALNAGIELRRLRAFCGLARARA